MKRHIQNEAAEMISDWKKNGFNGVHFIECYLEPDMWEDWEADGRTREEFEAFCENYACFVAQPAWLIDYEPSNKYKSVRIDLFQFDLDLRDEIKRRLGDDIEITHYRKCGEYEVQVVGSKPNE